MFFIAINSNQNLFSSQSLEMKIDAVAGDVLS